MLHSGEGHSIVDWWEVVRVIPCFSVVDCCNVLVGHDVKLVEVYLGHVSVHIRVDVLQRYEGDGNRLLFGDSRNIDDGDDGRKGIHWSAVNGEYTAVSELRVPAGDMRCWGRG